MTPAEIKKTKLYLALAKAVRKEDHAELARQLALQTGNTDIQVSELAYYPPAQQERRND